MIAVDIIRNAAAAGITLAARGDQLAVMPATLLSPDLRALLIAHKVELLDLLRRPANDTRPRNRAWTIVLVDGVKVTAVKDFAMAELFDDRAYRVERNTGSIVGNQA